MNRDELDTELAGIAMAVANEHERSVSIDATEAALVAVRRRVAAGDEGGGAHGGVGGVGGVRRSRSPWAVFAAAAVVVALVAGGVVAAIAAGRDDDTIVPGTLAPAPAPATTAPGSTSTIPTTTTTGSTPTSTSPVAPFVQQTIPVDATNPPPLIEPVVFATIPVEGDPDAIDARAAIGPDGIVVTQRSSAAGSATASSTGFASVSIVDFEGAVIRRFGLAENIGQIVAGPGDVMYGLGDPVFDEGDPIPRGFRFVAIATTGEQTGQVVAAAEVSLDDYVEIPGYLFGHGDDGVIDRGRQVGQTMIGYVDSSGVAPESSFEFTLPAFADTDGDGFREDATIVESVGTELSWGLDIVRDPAWTETYVGISPPAPTTDSRVIYAERIGPDREPEDDFGQNAMPVVAILNPDGSGRWVRLPDDWDVVSSDIWGTLLMRRTAGALEFALLDDAVGDSGPTTPGTTTTTVSSTDAALAIPDRCGVHDFNCTQLASTEDGRIVAYDPSGDTLDTYDATGMSLADEVSLAAPVSEQFPALIHIGPDDVAYLTIDTPGVDDPSRDLIAIPLVGSEAGTVVKRWTGLDGSGDSSLIARKAGLVSVPCCGPLVQRPADDAPIHRFVDRNGVVVESTAPTFRLDLGDGGNNLVRIESDGTSTFFSLPTVFSAPRDIPALQATDDGGGLGLDFVFVGSLQQTVIVDFDTDWPDVGIDNGDVWFIDELGGRGPVLLEPAGTLLLRDGSGGFVRRTLDDVGTRGWPGRAETDLESGATTAPGLNDYIDANHPAWAGDPGAFAVQLEPSVGPNETVGIDASDDGVITITTTGLLDDSAASIVRVITTERADDGLLRYVGGTYGFTCRPGRGHQDASTEPCT